jgi:hypothetical protein
VKFEWLIVNVEKRWSCQFYHWYAFRRSRSLNVILNTFFVHDKDGCRIFGRFSKLNADCWEMFPDWVQWQTHVFYFLNCSWQWHIQHDWGLLDEHNVLKVWFTPTFRWMVVVILKVYFLLYWQFIFSSCCVSMDRDWTCFKYWCSKLNTPIFCMLRSWMNRALTSSCLLPMPVNMQLSAHNHMLLKKTWIELWKLTIWLCIWSWVWFRGITLLL